MRFSIILFLFVFAFCEVNIYLNENKKCFYKQSLLPIVLLSLLAGLRAPTVGTDTAGYFAVFLGLDTYSMEKGFSFFIRLIRVLTDNPTVFLLIVAFIINTFIIRALWEYKDICPLYFSFFLFFFMAYFSTFSGIRQWMAVAITFYGSHFLLLKNKVLSFIICIIVACTFHLSAIVFILALPMWILIQRKNSLKKIVIIVLLFVVFIVLYYLYFDSYYSRYFHYLNNMKVFDISLIIPYRICLLLVCYTICKHSRTERFYYTETLIEKFNIVEIALYSLGFFENSMARISWYFMPLSFVYYGFVYKTRKKSLSSFIAIAMIFVLAFYSFYSLMELENNIVNYSFIWDR